MMTDQNKQDLRHAALDALVRLPRLYQTVDQVRMGVFRLLPFEISKDDVRDALEFLIGLRTAERINDPFGSEKLYKATAEGILLHERSQAS